MGFVSPLVSPARKLAPHPPSLFSPYSRETMPAQSSTDFLTHTLRLCHLKNWMPSKSISGRPNLRGRLSIPKLFIICLEMLPERSRRLFGRANTGLLPHSDFLRDLACAGIPDR